MSDSGKASGVVKNPLTVIAVFAGLAEVSATIALPQLSDSVQNIFVWFVMLFPSLLVILFFATLWKNHRVLYAPSDFQNENNFMSYWTPQSISEIENSKAVEISPPPETSMSANTESVDSSTAPATEIRSNLYAEHTAAEDFALEILASKYGVAFQRNVSFSGSKDIQLDAVASTPRGPLMVEVTLVSSLNAARKRLSREFERAAAISYKIPKSDLRGAELVIAVVFTAPLREAERKDLRMVFERHKSIAGLPYNIRLEILEMSASEEENE